MDILNSDEDPNIITWLPRGCGFAILDKKRFSNEVLPKYFKESKYTSFTRRMNRWRFTIRKHGHQKSAYFHPKFDRNNPEHCRRMVPSLQTCYPRKTKEEDAGRGRQAKHALQTSMSTTLNSDTDINKNYPSLPFMHDDAQRIPYSGHPISGRHIPAISSEDTAIKGDAYPHVAFRRDQQEQAFTYTQVHMQNPCNSMNQAVQVNCNVSIEQINAERQANHAQEMMMASMVPRLRTPNFAYSNMMPEYAGYGGSHNQHLYPMMLNPSPGQRSSHLFSQDEQAMASMRNYYTFGTRSSQSYSASNGAFSGNNVVYPYQDQMY
jgi:hypothetical protein